MKQMVFLIVWLVVGFAFPALAQEPAKDAAKPEPTKEAAKPMADKPKQAAAGPKKPRRWNEDARHCLERGSNTDIIKCAEEFL
jgi:hypothetical protein